MVSSKSVKSKSDKARQSVAKHSVQQHHLFDSPKGAKLYKIKKWEVAFEGRAFRCSGDGYITINGLVYDNLTVAYDSIPPQYVCDFIQKKVLAMASTPSGRKFLGVTESAFRHYNEYRERQKVWKD